MKRIKSVVLITVFLFLVSCNGTGLKKTDSTSVMPSASGEIINALENGVIAGSGIDNAPAVNRIFKLLKNGDTVYFPEGTYEFGSTLRLTGKKNITLVGDRARFVRIGVDNTEAVSGGDSCTFFIENDFGLSIKNLTVSYQGITSVSGTVSAGDPAEGTLNIRAGAGIEVTGSEFFSCIDSFDENGFPDHALERYEPNGFGNRLLEDGTLQIAGLSDSEVRSAPAGTRVCLRAAMENRYMFIILNSGDLNFEDITVTNAYNGVFLIEPYTRNAAFRRVRVRPDNENALMSANADALHISGLSGELIVEDCEFHGVGDDCVNVHTRACIAESVSGETMTVTDGSTSEPVSDREFKKGDVVEFFDPQTFLSLGTAPVIRRSGNRVDFDALPDGVEDGTVLSNRTLHPSVSIRNTTVTSNRARAFLLQTENVIVENCTISGTALAAILIAPDIVRWYEMAPARHVVIRNNRIEKCGAQSGGAISLQTSHDGAFLRYPSGIHEDITVEGNTFSDCGTSAVYAVSTAGLRIINNRLEGITGKETHRYAVYTVNSDSVTVTGNHMSGGIKELFGCKNTTGTNVEKSGQ